MSQEDLEGWFNDPYLRHEARWLSDGKATKLVRDGTDTSYEEPPPSPLLETPERIEADPASTEGGDLKRADEAESGDPYDPEQARWAVYDQLGAQPPSAFDNVSRRWPPD